MFPVVSGLFPIQLSEAAERLYLGTGEFDASRDWGGMLRFEQSDSINNTAVCPDGTVNWFMSKDSSGVRPNFGHALWNNDVTNEMYVTFIFTKTDNSTCSTVPNGGGSDTCGSIGVINGASSAKGPVTLARHIVGPATRLKLPHGAWVDASRNLLYVANSYDSSILIWRNASTIDGNVAPDTVLKTDSTYDPIHVYVDTINDRLFVVHRKASAGHGESPAISVWNNASRLGGTNSTPAMRIYGGNSMLDSGNNATTHNVWFDSASQFLIVGHHTSEVLFYPMKNINWSPAVRDTAPKPYALRDHDGTDTFDWSTYGFYYLASRDRLYAATGYTSPGTSGGSGPPNIGSPKNVVRVYEGVSQINSDTNPMPVRKIYWDNGGTYLPPQPLWVTVYPDALRASRDWYVNDTYSSSADSFTYVAGSDTAGAGTANYPFRSINRALQCAKSGDTIYVDAGRYVDSWSYVVVGSETAAFRIDTDNLTIIGKDSGATVFDPPGASTVSGVYGIYADTQTGLVIKNLGVTGAFDGIKFVNVDSSVLSADSLSSNGNSGAYFLNGSDSNTLTGVTASNNVAGFFFSSSSKNLFSNNLCVGNSGISFNLTAGGNNTLTGNSALNNTDVAFYLNSSTGNIVTNNRAVGNTSHGFYLSSAAGNVLVLNTADSNAQYQFYIDGSSSSDTVQKNNIRTSSTNPDSGVYNASTAVSNKFAFTRNWWGATDEVAIKKMIYQGSAGDSVAWIPYRLGQADTAAGADTTAPLAPIGVTCTAAAGPVITVTWAIPTVNEETNGGSVGYGGAKIYRLTNTVDTTNWANSTNLVRTAGSTETQWSDTTVTGGNTYYYRLTSLDTQTIVNQSFFADTKSATASPVSTWYVNDTYSSSADSFTYAGGSDTSYGAGTTTKPFRSVAKALQSAKSGDTIVVDAGFYADTGLAVSATETAAIRIDTDNITIIGKDSMATVIDPVGSSATAGIYGVYADTQSGIVIRTLSISGAYDGFHFENVDSSTLSGDSVGNAGNNGIYFSSKSESNTVTGNAIHSAGINGMYFLNGPARNLIAGNLVTGAGQIGIYISTAETNTVTSNIVSSSNLYGFYLWPSANFNTISSNTVQSNSRIGIFLNAGSNENAISNNIVDTNGPGGTGDEQGGIVLWDSRKNVISGNICRSNNHQGIYLHTGSDTNRVMGNLVARNLKNGIGISASRWNVLVQNQIDSNAEYQITITGASTADTAEKNTFRPSPTNPDSIVYSGATGQKFVFLRNWWDTTDEITIRKRIASIEAGDSVKFSPYRLGPIDSAVGADSTAPLPPIGVALTPDTVGQIKVSWTTPTLNEETNGVVVAYNGAKIYRLTNTVDTTNWGNPANLVFTTTSSATSWTDTTTLAGNVYYYRLSSIDTSSVVNQSFFTDTVGARATRSVWYVNDTYSSTADSFTYAAGSDTGFADGSPSKPYRSAAKIMQFIKSGDTLYMDAGLYADTYVNVSSTETAAFKIDTDNITIIGKDSNTTVIDPPGGKTIPGVFGIYADTQVGLVIKNLGVTGAYVGIKLVNVDSSSVIGDSTGTLGRCGIYLLNGSDSNILSYNIAGYSSNSGVDTFSGIYLDSSSNNLISFNVTGSNSTGGGDYTVAGIYLTSSSNNVITNNSADSNSSTGGNPSVAVGIFIGKSTYNTVTNNSTMSNSATLNGFGAGIYLASSSQNKVNNNIANGNGGSNLGPSAGIYLNSSSNNTLGFNIVKANFGTSSAASRAGIYLSSSSNNLVLGNTADSNLGAGCVWIDGTSIDDTFTKNNFVESSVVNKTVNSFDFRGNWWGTTDELGFKTPGTDSILFNPYRLGQVDTSSTGDTTAPGLPASVILDTTAAGLIKLTWTIPTVNEETNGGSVGYSGAKIYRIKNLADTTNWANSVNLVRTASATDTSWTDTEVTFGDTFYYRLTSFDTATFVNQSFFTDTKWATPTARSTVRVYEDSMFTDDVDTYLTRDILYIEVRDSDENRAAAVETVTVTVYVGNGTTERDSSGLVLDTETIVLTESGASSGIFRSDTIVLTDTLVPIIGDGRLSWGRGDTLHVKYADANDATDSASDTVLAIEIASTSKINLFEDVAFTDEVDTYKTRDIMYVQVQDTDENRNPQIKDTVAFIAYIGNNVTGLVTDTETIVLTENAETSGIFRGPAVNFTDTVASVSNDGFLTWATSDTVHVVYTDVTGTSESSSDTALLTDTSVQANTGPFWYVNDTSTAGDGFTTAAGSDTDGVGTATSPYRTILKALSSARAGDTIYVDKGIYDSFVSVSSTETAGIKIDTDNLSLIGKDSNATVIDPPGDSSRTGLYGIYASARTGLVIKNIGLIGAYDGMRLTNVDRSVIRGDSASSNGRFGIYLDNAETTQIDGCEAHFNANSGILVYNSSYGCTASNNRANSNVFYGLEIGNAKYNILSGNFSESNGVSGMALDGNANLNTLTNNLARANAKYGIYLYSTADSNTFRNNRLASNVHAGILIELGSGNIVVQNDIFSGDTGVWIQGASVGNTIDKNNITSGNVNLIYNQSGRVQTLIRNWWGTTDEVAITAKFSDTASTFRPYRLTIVDTATGADTTAPGLPANISLDTSVGNIIKLTWTIPTINEETNGGNVAYGGLKVYRLRNTVDTNNWANTANLVWIAGATDTSWFDTGVVGNETYYYRLASFDTTAVFNRSFFTDTKFAKADSTYAGPKWYVNDTYSSTSDSFTYAGGSDTGGDGSTSKPFRSAARAMQKVKAGDTVYLDAGRYVDTYVVVSSTETAAFKIDTHGLFVIGKDSAATVIDPPGDSRVRNLYGIYASGVSGVTVKNLGVFGAGAGIYFTNVDSSTITGDSASHNGHYGIALRNFSDSNLVSSNTTYWNDSYGIFLENCSGNLVSNNLATSNQIQGIYLYGSSWNTLSANTANSNAAAGISIDSGSNNSLTGNTANSNAGHGIEITDAIGFRLVGNVTLSNQSRGILLESGALNYVADNLVKSNSRVGVNLLNSDTNIVTQNEIRGNDTGVLIEGASRGNVIVKNIIDTNTTSNIYNAAGLAQTLTRNWWGTTDEVTIAAKFKDTISVFRPYRLGNIDTAAGADTTAPLPPLGVTLDTGTAGQIKVTWAIPTLNEETNGGAVGYNGANIWRLANQVDTTNWANPVNLVRIASSAETTWSDTTVTAGVTYYYRLTSKDTPTIFNESFFTDTKFATAPAAGTTATQKWYVNDTYSSSADSFTYVGGSDTGGSGSTSLPYRSVAKALQSAKSGDTIVVDAGIYTDTYEVVGGINVFFDIDTDYLSIIGKDSISTVFKAPLSPSFFSGVYADTQVGLLLKDLRITGAWADGVVWVNVRHSTIENVRSDSNGGAGIYLMNADSNLLKNNWSESNSIHGVLLQAGCDTNSIIDNVFKQNSQVGIWLYQSGSQNEVRGNQVDSNLVGIDLHSRSNHNRVSSNRTAYNRQYDIGIEISDSNVIYQNYILYSDTGIYVSGQSSSNQITKNNFYGNKVNNVYSLSSRDSGLSQFYSRNWWDTTDEVTIKSKFTDTASTFVPYRFGPVDTSAGGDSTAPGLPASVALDTTTASIIKVSWTIPTVNEETNGGAVGYAGAKIYRLTNTADTNNWSNSANLVRVASSTDTTWSDTTVTAGNTYYYRLTSFDGSSIVNQSFFTDTKASKPSSTTGLGVDSITIDSGNHQLGTISTRLTYALRVRLTDSAGNPVPYSPVRFDSAYPTGGPGAYFGDSSTKTTTLAYTDTNGYVSETFTLGAKRGVYLITARADSNTSKKALFYAYAEGLDVEAAKWKMVTPNKARISSTTFGGLILDDLASAIGYAWNENAGTGAGLSEYSQLSSSSTIDTGRAYWVYNSTASSLTTQGTAAFDTISIQLTAGWHMIGSAQYFYVDWDSGVQFDTNGTKYYPAQADSRGIIKNIIYWYSGAGYYWGPDAATPALSRIQMKPNVGFWLFTNKACTMWVYPNPASPAETSTLILQQAPWYPGGREGERERGREFSGNSMAAKYQDGGSEADWLIRLSASSGEQSDFQNYIGVKATAEEAVKSGVYDPPPAAGNYVSIGIAGEDGIQRAASFVEPITTVKTWKINLATDLDTPVTVSWENVSNIPAKYAAFLIGGPSGAVDLRKVSSTVLSKSAGYGSGLTLAVGLPDYLASYLAAPLSKDQTFVYPNPGPDGTTGQMSFKYNLQTPSEVTLRIFDLGGKLVRELKQSGTAGSNILTWDTTNSHGQKLGSSVYIYILQSGSTKLVDKLAILR